MSKHTPGPWKTETDLPYGEKPRVENNDKLICEVGNADPAHIAQDEWEANAILIAAAPEMLEALDIVVGCLLWNKQDEASIEVMRRVNAVRAKAEGRS